MPNYWLFKTEPDTFSILDLEKSPQKTTCWEGVRNYQARNMLRDDIKKGDFVLFYHSRVQPMAVMGTAKVSKSGYPDPFQFDTQSKYYDPKASQENPRWYLVDIKLDTVFKTPVTLAEMRTMKSLEGMKLLQKGQRLSVQPVTKGQWNIVTKKGNR